LRGAEDAAGEGVVVGLEPGRDGANLFGRPPGDRRDRRVDDDPDPRLVGEQGGGNVEPPAVDLDVPVDDELARLAPGEARPSRKTTLSSRRSSSSSSASPAVVSCRRRAFPISRRICFSRTP
jgi:hypothetical protein